MKPNILLIFYLLIAAFFLSCDNEPIIDPDYRPGSTDPFAGTKTRIGNPDNDAEGTLVSVQIHSPALEGNLLGDPADRSVNIYLPKSYYSCPEKRFPVIYFLHGMPTGENSLIDPLPFEIFRQMAQLQAQVDFPQEGFTGWVNHLINEGRMNEVIIVMPDAANKYALSCYTNSTVQGDYEDYIVSDLVSYIDTRYRTIPNFNFRAVAGHCMGGYGALRLAMKNPHIFRYVAALSPAILPEESVLFIAQYILMEQEIWGFPGPTPYNPSAPFKFATNSLYGFAAAWLPNPDNPPYYVDLPFTYVNGIPVPDEELMAQWNAQSLFALVTDHPKELEKLKIVYFDCGIYDELGMYPPDQALHDMMLSMNLDHHFETYEGTHISHLYERLAKVLSVLSDGFPSRE
jgi:S-formylglutathione hydrolase FrmB